jgi:multiple sugar transport system permease protein
LLGRAKPCLIYPGEFRESIKEKGGTGMERAANLDSTKKINLKKRLGKQQLKEMKMGYLFIGPMMLGVIVFSLFPILCSFALSFTNWSFVSGYQNIHFIGVRNFINLFNDNVFLQSLKNNLWLLISVPLTLAVSLTLAIVINKYVYWRDLFKVVFFIPQICSIVAVAIVWQVVFHPTFGPVNSMLKTFGMLDPPKWLGDPHYALFSVIFLMVWIGMGVAMVIYIAGLQDIPADLYEAADIDGAGWWAKFKSITFPMLSRTTFFLFVTEVIGTFKSFALIKVLTNGGPANSTSVIAFSMYKSAFEDLKTGYASSMAIVLFICVFAITLFQLFVQRRWLND